MLQEAETPSGDLLVGFGDQAIPAAGSGTTPKKPLANQVTAVICGLLCTAVLQLQVAQEHVGQV